MKYLITRREVAEQPVLVGRRRAPKSGVAAAISEVLTGVFQLAQEHGIALTGSPFVRYLDANPELMTFEPGMPIGSDVDPERGSEQREEAGLTFDVLPGGAVATTVHVGPYETLQEAYAAIERWIADEGMTAAGGPWESYLTDPLTEPDPTHWETEILWPLSPG